MQTTKPNLTDIVETLEDGRKGFEQGAAKLVDSDRHDLASQFREYSQQRARFSAELREVAARHGVEIETSGSVGGAVHRGWMALKDALSGDDPDGVLDAAEQGEDHAVSEYEDALERSATELPADVHDVLVRQYNEVRAAHDAVKALRDRADS